MSCFGVEIERTRNVPSNLISHGRVAEEKQKIQREEFEDMGSCLQRLSVETLQDADFFPDETPAYEEEVQTTIFQHPRLCFLAPNLLLCLLQRTTRG